MNGGKGGRLVLLTHFFGFVLFARAASNFVSSSAIFLGFHTHAAIAKGAFAESPLLLE
jgi:hypothetical protein